MEFLTADAAGERARIIWLIRLRWIAVLGVLGAVVTAGPVLHIMPRVAPLLVGVSALAVWNGLLSLRLVRGYSVQAAGSQVIVDLLVLGYLLFWSDGLRNPFAIFLGIQVMLAGILLPRRTAVDVGMAGVAITVLLGAMEFFQWLPRNEGPVVMPVWGAGIALILTIAVALQLVTLVMDDLRHRAADAQRFHLEAERQRQRLFDVMRFAGASLVLLDPTRRVEWQNRRSMASLGEFPTGAPLDLPGLEGWPPAAALSSTTPVELEWAGPDRDRRQRIHQVTATAIRDRAGQIEQIVLVFTDITDRRVAEQHLQRTEKLAALGRLAAGVAHEINTPLGSVSILTSEVRDAIRDLSLPEHQASEITESLDDIRRETDRVATLVRRLLDLTHPRPEPAETLDLGEVVADAVRLISVRSPDARRRITMEHRLDSPVETNHDRFRQVLLNLVDNALDATRRNQGSVVVRTARDGQRAIVEVADSGEGIAPEDLPRVFDPFFTTKDVGEGTGLGLYVSYEIMKNLGGDIAIDSTVGTGTTVRLTLPLAVSAGEQVIHLTGP